MFVFVAFLSKIHYATDGCRYFLIKNIPLLKSRGMLSFLQSGIPVEKCCQIFLPDIAVIPLQQIEHPIILLCSLLL